MNYVERIKSSGKTIYDKITPEEMIREYIPKKELEKLLDEGLRGLDLSKYPIRTRSKIVKTEICQVLGYPAPKTFNKVQPRFPAQNLDVYTQKSLNLQIWNEELVADRRYALVRVDENNVVTKVRVVNGEELEQYDKTGKLTKKYQARVPNGESRLFSESDTENIVEWCEVSVEEIMFSPSDDPIYGQLLTIEDLYKKLQPLIGEKIKNIDAVQERNRGAELHKLVCARLGYKDYRDNGQYPDIKNQLLEIKLQTSPTIDLGQHLPESDEAVMDINDKKIRNKDVRYAIFTGSTFEEYVILDKLFMVTGEDFPSRFQMFKGMVQNVKIQIPLPNDFFDD